MNFGSKFWNSTKYGEFKFEWLILFYIPLIILAPCYTYYMCVIKNKECKPYHSTITQTANHYPQNIAFRFIMGTSTSVLILIFYILYRWINLQARNCGFPQMRKIAFYSMMLAMLCQSIAVQTIDGLDNGPLHGPSAVIFFVTFEVIIVYMTLYLYRLRQWNSSVISPTSFLLKAIVALQVTLIWIYCLYGALVSTENNIDFTVLVEWNSFFLDLIWLLSFALEWRKIKVCFIQIKKSQRLQI